MPYITSAERFGEEKGRRAGLKEGLKEGAARAAQELIRETLFLRFGHVPPEIESRISSVNDMTLLKEYHRRSVTCSKLDEFLPQPGEK